MVCRRPTMGNRYSCPRKISLVECYWNTGTCLEGGLFPGSRPVSGEICGSGQQHKNEEQIGCGQNFNHGYFKRGINKSVVVKINGSFHSIRIIEECFGDVTWNYKESKQIKESNGEGSSKWTNSYVDSILDIRRQYYPATCRLKMTGC